MARHNFGTKTGILFHFMAETKPFENITPFTLDLSKSFRDKHKKLTYKKLKAVIIKKYMVILIMSLSHLINR